MNPIRLLALTSLATLLVGGCSPPPPPPEPVRPLRVITVGAADAPWSARGYSGEVRPRIETTLGFRVRGKIIARLANVGDHVRAGQVLARLDPEDTQLNAEQAEAQRVLAAAEAARYRDLRRQNFVSQAALDARETALRAATATADLARNQASYATLVADRAGVIGLVQADVGQVVSEGQAVFRVAPDGDREIAMNVPEAEYSRFRVGQTAEVAIYAMPGKTFRGTVREISPTADPVTRTYALRVQLPGIEKLPTGLSATVHFPAAMPVASQPAGFGVPLTAVYQRDGQTAVWVVGQDDTVSLRPVRVAAWGDRFATVTEGLADGERIAAAGVNRLVAGQQVRPIDIAAP